MKENKRTKYYIIVLLLVLVMGIGYAAIQSTLNINGTAMIKISGWNVHFENLHVTDGSVAINTTAGDVAAAIEDTNKTSVDYVVTLEKPGDFYEFTVEAVNGGTMDAKISSVVSKMNNAVITTLPTYLEYSVTNQDGTPIEVDHALNSGNRETYKVRVAYSQDLNPGDLPTTPSSYVFNFAITYIQK